MTFILLAGTQEPAAFGAFDCNNKSAPIKKYSLFDLELCRNMQKAHSVQRELYGEMVQIMKERLVQVPRRTMTNTIELWKCGFQSRAGIKWYNKLRELLAVEPADCRMAAKTGEFKIKGKDYPIKMNVQRTIIVNLIVGLDNKGNCEVGMYEIKGMPLRSQVVIAVRGVRPAGVGKGQ
jgi:hypothetical protein